MMISYNFWKLCNLAIVHETVPTENKWVIVTRNSGRTGASSDMAQNAVRGTITTEIDEAFIASAIGVIILNALNT